MIINSAKGADQFAGTGFTIVTIDATTLALDVLGRPITNVPMLGALAAAANLVGLDSLLQAIDDHMPHKVREANKQLLVRSFEAVKGGGAA